MVRQNLHSDTPRWERVPIHNRNHSIASENGQSVSLKLFFFPSINAGYSHCTHSSIPWANNLLVSFFQSSFPQQNGILQGFSPSWPSVFCRSCPLLWGVSQRASWGCSNPWVPHSFRHFVCITCYYAHSLELHNSTCQSMVFLL